MQNFLDNYKGGTSGVYEIDVVKNKDEFMKSCEGFLRKIFISI